MKNISPIRLLVTLAAALLLLLVLLVGVLLTDTLLNIRHNLQQAPLWVWLLILGGLSLFLLFSGWLVMRLLKPRTRPALEGTENRVPSEQELTEQLAEVKALGADTAAAEKELSNLQQRKASGTIQVAVFGEISSGKSSLIKALMPGQEIEISVTGGTTRELESYCWTSPAGDRLILTDMPGLDESGGHMDQLARDEALRAHLVIYVCDGDLTRSQFQELENLLDLDKPTIVAINKIDLFNQDQLQQITDQIRQRVDQLGQAEVIPITTGATQSGIRIGPDGAEESFQRQLPPQLDELQQAVQRIIDSDQELLNQLRDSAVFVLVSRQLEEAANRQRAQQADKLVQNYSRKAVVGAVAAMTPGTDLLIQGYLATRMIKEMAGLYQLPVRNIDVEMLLQLIQEHVRTQTTLILAIAGNALKAFPGAGTLAGGALHAVAYGFLFESLGKSVAQSLQSRGELHPVQIATEFEDRLGEDFKASAGRYAKLALKEITRNK